MQITIKVDKVALNSGEREKKAFPFSYLDRNQFLLLTNSFGDIAWISKNIQKYLPAFSYFS